MVGPTWMQSIANKTKGRFYNVTNPKALPRIYQKEARLISRPLTFELPNPWMPTVQSFTEPIAGLPKEMPGITGADPHATQGERTCGAAPDVRATHGADQPLTRTLDLRAGSLCRVDIRHGASVDQGLAYMGQLLRILVADREVVAPPRRQRQPHDVAASRGRQGQGCHRCARQEQPVSQLPQYSGQRGRFPTSRPKPSHSRRPLPDVTKVWSRRPRRGATTS